jgi:phospholipase/lecithinase/hemolysin
MLLTEINIAIPHLGQINFGQIDFGQILRDLKAVAPPQVECPQTLVPNFDGLIIFGDSLSDPGNLLALTGFFPPPPYSQGRFSNGDIWADYLTDEIGLGAAQVQNFAVGGAKTGRGNGLNPLVSLLTGTEASLPGLLDQVDGYLDGLGESAANADSLYVVWAGGNDLLNLPSDSAAIPVFLTSAVQNVATTIASLAERGADTFLVPTLPNLGLTPQTRRDGTSEQATALSLAFNAELAETLIALEQSPLFEIDIISVDLFELTTAIASAPAQFGFTNVTDPLIGQGGPNLNNPGFFWWDQLHPTTQTHALLADVFQTSLVEAGYLVPGNSVIPTLATSDFALAGVAAPEGTLDSYCTGWQTPTADSLSPLQAASSADLAYQSF